MRKFKQDNEGNGAIFGLLILLALIFAFIVVPFIVGWAITLLLSLFTGDPEITAFWTRWFIGVAILIVALVFVPNRSKVINNFYGNARDWSYSRER